MVIDNKKQEFISEVMNTALFSMTEKFNIIKKLKDEELSEEDINKISDLIHDFDNWLAEIANEYYSDMDKIYAQYLDKNIPILTQEVAKMELEVKEIKTDEEEWDPDLLLDQINKKW